MSTERKCSFTLEKPLEVVNLYAADAATLLVMVKVMVMVVVVVVVLIVATVCRKSKYDR
jgi:hypothetical protein